MMRHDDGALKGYFFVVYADETAAQDCIANQTEFMGNPVECKGADGGKNTKPGDWTCPMCYDNVFSFRDTCNRCGYWGGMWGCGSKGGKGGGSKGNAKKPG